MSNFDREVLDRRRWGRLAYGGAGCQGKWWWSGEMIDDNPHPGGQIWRDGPQVALPESANRHRQAVVTKEGHCAASPAASWWRNLALTDYI